MLFYDYSCHIFFLQPIAEGNCDLVPTVIQCMIFGISNDSNVDYISLLFVWFIFCRLLHFFANIPEFVKSAQDLASLDFKAANLIIALTGLPILLTNVVLHSVSDHKRGQDSLEATESTSSHFSYLFFSWMDNLIWKG